MKWVRTGRTVALVVLSCGILVYVAGCGSDGDTDPASLEGIWTLESYLADGEMADADPGLGSGMTLEAGDVTGEGGINSFRGSYEAIDDGSITFGPLAATQMAGVPEAMDQEIGFLAALDAAESFSVSGQTLTLSDTDGETVAVLVSE